MKADSPDDTLRPPSWRSVIDAATGAARNAIGWRTHAGADADDIGQAVAIRLWTRDNPSTKLAALTAKRQAIRQTKPALPISQQDGPGSIRRGWTYQRYPKNGTPQRGSCWPTEDRQELREALGKLPEHLRLCLEWFLACGGNQRRAAKSMRMSQTTYHRTFTAAVAELRGMLRVPSMSWDRK